VKVITLRQPWATLFVCGVKGPETRSWGTSYRGELGIHASATMKPDETALCYTPPFQDALTKLGYLGPGHLPKGALLGTADLIDCIEMTAEYIASVPPEHRPFGFYAPGRFAWVARNFRRFDQVTPARGSLGLWIWPTSTPTEEPER
jgi:hypothetical protein